MQLRNLMLKFTEKGFDSAKQGAIQITYTIKCHTLV